MWEARSSGGGMASIVMSIGAHASLHILLQSADASIPVFARNLLLSVAGLIFTKSSIDGQEGIMSHTRAISLSLTGRVMV